MEKDKNMKTYNYIWKLIKYRPWLYLINCILWIIIHASPLIPGLLAKEFFDTLSGEASLNVGVWGIMVLIIMAALTRVMFIYAGGRTDCIHRFNMSALIRRNMLECILNMPGAKSITCSVGEAVNCFRDDAEQAEDSISWTLDIIGSAVFAIAAIFILLTINARITLLVFTPLIAVVAISQKASERIEKYREASREATSKVSGAMGEAFNSVQAIKASGAEKDVLKYINRLNKKRHKLMLRDSILNQLLESVYINTVSFGTGLILLLVGQSIKGGSFSVGDFALFVYFLNFVADFTQFFGTFIAHYQQTGVAFRRMIELLKDENKEILVKGNKLYLKGTLPREAYNEIKEEKKLRSIEVKNLTCHYENSDSGIDNVSFEMKRGQVTVITGRIASGKTTLLKALLGLMPKSSGEIYWNNIMVKEPQCFFVPPISSYTSQIPNLFSDTVKNNIFLGIEKKDDDLKEAILSAVLEKDIETLDKGLETVIGPKGVKLSGGQIQRVAAARMFIRTPELLVFDDISSALDIETEIKLWDRLFEGKCPTCLVVSNRRYALQQADNIIVMKNGKVEAQGSLEELLTSCEEMQQIWGQVS